MEQHRHFEICIEIRANAQQPNAGLTGSGFIVLAATLSSVEHIPVAAIALILGVDRFMSEARALTNLHSPSVGLVMWRSLCHRRRIRPRSFGTQSCRNLSCNRFAAPRARSRCRPHMIELSKHDPLLSSLLRTPDANGNDICTHARSTASTRGTPLAVLRCRGYKIRFHLDRRRWIWTEKKVAVC